MRIAMMVCLLLLGSPAWADRVALVVGNAGYATSPLANPLRDARAVEAVLKELGFSVTLLENASRSQMVRGVQGFRERLRTGGIGFFYYSGHGVEIGGKNYLLPVGTVVRTQEDVLAEALDAGYVVAQMEAAGSQLNLVVLDACRDNPLPSSSKSAGKGLSRMEGGAGTLIAFATAAGQTAADGSGDNSPYTQVLVEQLRRSDLSVSELFNETNLEVARRTRNQQRPWYSTSGVPTLRLTKGGALVQAEAARVADSARVAEEQRRAEAARLAEEKRRASEELFVVLLRAKGSKFIDNKKAGPVVGYASITLKIPDAGLEYDYWLDEGWQSQSIRLTRGKHEYSFEPSIETKQGTIENICRGFLDVRGDSVFGISFVLDKHSLTSCAFSPSN